jgi:hypothetical protein
MARFSSTVAIAVDGHKSYKAGTTYADTKVNAIGNDVVWPACGTSAGMSPGLIPLDASAIAIYNASRFAGTTIPRPDGCNSIS